MSPIEIEKKGVWVAAFDIGKKNFCWCIEEFDPALLNIPNVKVRYNANGTCTQGMENILQKIYKNGRVILHKNLDITDGCDPGKKLDPRTFLNMYRVLDEHIRYWDLCDVILIEEQMHFGRKVNMMAIKLAQCCFSYFVFKYAEFTQKVVTEFPAYHKTQVLGAEKAEGKPYKSGKKRYVAVEKKDRKDWAVIEASNILHKRGEKLGGGGKKKLDDLADTFLMIQAYKYLKYVGREKIG